MLRTGDLWSRRCMRTTRALILTVLVLLVGAATAPAASASQAGPGDGLELDHSTFGDLILNQFKMSHTSDPQKAEFKARIAKGLIEELFYRGGMLLLMQFISEPLMLIALLFGQSILFV